MALPKRHWGNAAQSPGFVPDAACGRSGVREIITTSALAFDVSVSRNTDWYCADCAKAARLALAKESAPKPDAVVWPKPRPIEEYTGNDHCLGLCKHYGWLTVRPERSKSGNHILGWLTCCPSAAYVIPTHFLPLPPEVQTP